MLLRFVYLDTTALSDYIAQLDGGTLVETKTRKQKRRGGGGKLGTGPLGANFDFGNDDENAKTYTDPPAAQFQRLLAIGTQSPEALAWQEVLEPDFAFGELRGYEMLLWECNADMHETSRLMSSGGGGARTLDMMPALLNAMVAQATSKGEEITPEIAAKMQQFEGYVDVAKELIDGAKIKPVVICTAPGTKWTLYGELNRDFLRVDDIVNEQLTVVGKVKRIVDEGEWRRVVTVQGLPVASMGSKRNPDSGTGEPPTEILDSFLRGPALELDILAIYR